MTTLGQTLKDYRTLLEVPTPRRKVSIRSQAEPTAEFDDTIIGAGEFRTLYPHLLPLAKYVESDGFQYLSLQVDEFVLQIMRWV